MKKNIIISIIVLLFISCAQNKETDKKDLSGFTFEGPEIDLIKKAVQQLYQRGTGCL